MDDSFNKKIKNTAVFAACGDVVHRMIVKSGKSGVSVRRRNHHIGLIKDRNAVSSFKYNNAAVVHPVTAALQLSDYRFPHSQRNRPVVDRNVNQTVSRLRIFKIKCSRIQTIQNTFGDLL